MKIGCCVNMLPRENGGFGQQYLPLIRQVGFDYVELPIAQVITLSQSRFDAARALLRDLSLPVRACNNFFAPEVRMIGPNVDKALVRERYCHALEWAAALGATYAVFGSPWAKMRPEDFPLSRAFDQLVEWCGEMGDEAARRGIILALEPNNRTETNMINTFSQAVELAKAVSHPSVRCIHDYFHLCMEQETTRSMLEHGQQWLVHTHFARIEDRGFPRSAEEDPGYALFFDALRAIGYEGGVSIEAFLTGRDSFLWEAATACSVLRRL